MLIPKELVIEAKAKLGEKAALIIAEDLELQDFNIDNLKGCCPFHNEETPSFIWNNKDSCFKCFGCGKVYGIIDHFMSFNKLTYIEACEKLFLLTDTKFRFSEKGIKAQSRNYKYPHLEINDRTKAEKYLKSRGILAETLDYCNVGSDINGNIAFHFFDTNDVLTTVKYRSIKTVLDKKDNKEWCQPNADTTPLLYNMNKIDLTLPLVITEGEIDCLSVIEAGFKNVVSVPFGAGNSTWIEQNFDWLESFDKIILWADNDAAGMLMRKNVIGRLGDWRCYYVDLPETLEINGEMIKIKDANDVLCKAGKQAVLDLINSAEEMPVTHVMDLYDVGDYDLEHSEGLYSGFDELDEKIYKFVFGTLCILTGINASGKSVLLNQMFICEPLNQGYDTFVFSGELTKPQLKNWIELVMAGREHVTLTNNHIRKIDPESRKLMQNWYRGRIWVYDDDKNFGASAILEKMETLARKYGVKVFTIDNLMTIDLECSQETIYIKQKEFVLKLANFANKYNVFVTLVAHPKKLQEERRVTKRDISGSGDITNIAHYVMGVHRYSPDEHKGSMDSKGNYYKGKEPILNDGVIDFFKNRITGTQDFSIQTNFDIASYRFYTDLNGLYKRYKWDKSKTPLPTYDPKEDVDKPDFIKS